MAWREVFDVADRGGENDVPPPARSSAAVGSRRTGAVRDERRAGTGRQLWVVAHRWAGLTLAVFLVVVGATGVLLPWRDELTRLGRPGLSQAAPPRPGARVLDGATLAERVERRTGAKVGYLALDLAPDHVATLTVTPPAGAARAYDTVWADPYTGDVRLRFRDGVLADGPQTIMDFLYGVHRQLALGRPGELTLGIAALVWTVDCFVGFYLTFPLRRRREAGPAEARDGWWARWRPAWAVRWRRGSYRLTFDLHRAGGLWLWPVLLVFAWSSVGLNLREVEAPVMRVFGGTSYAPPPPVTLPAGARTMGLREAQRRGEALLRGLGRRDGFAVLRPSWISYDPGAAAWRYNVRTTRDVLDRGGRTTVTLSAVDGRLLGFDPPVEPRAADAFMQWLDMLHFAQVFGLPYRAFVSAVGALVVLLSVTGVLVWMRKRSARLAAGRAALPVRSVRRRTAPASPSAAEPAGAPRAS